MDEELKKKTRYGRLKEVGEKEAEKTKYGNKVIQKEKKTKSEEKAQ